MSDPKGFDFTKFVPGFDFLKNLTPGASGTAAAPGWVAPTLDPEELDKRIQELKTVQFWLEQNAKAVGATIQALEVQRMTLATLKGMNMSFNDLADSLKVKPSETPQPEEPVVKKTKRNTTKAKAAGIDPSHWWGALTDQFQHIAHKAMTDMAHAHDHKAAPQTSAPSAKKTAAKKTSARKAPAKKVTAKSKR
jgi:hypothetical protein